MRKFIMAACATTAWLSFAGIASAQTTTETVPADSSAPSASAHHGIGVALRLSALQGIGVEGIYGLSEHLNLRGQFNYFSLNRDFHKDGIDYDGHLKLRTAGALIDYHPFAGSFRLSLGLYNDGNELNAVAVCHSGSQCQVGDATVSSSGGSEPTVHAAIDMKQSVAPYLGFGWGNAMQGGPLHFAFDIGVMFQGSPKVDMSASGTGNVSYNGSPAMTADLGTDPTFQAQLAKERADLQDSVKDYKFFPAIAFTVGYRFGG